LGILITACVVLAAAQAAAALLILLLIAIVWGVFVYPRETFGLLSFCLAASFIERAPFAFVGVVAILAAVSLVRHAR
jgi:hypothetical protein